LGLNPIAVPSKEGTIHDIDPAEIKAAIRDDTIAIVGTAGTWPYGSIDPIKEMGRIAEDYDIYFHVDACFGGFILPFLELSGYHSDLPIWDFRVPGVMSISADLHKNGMVPPPASSLYFKNSEAIQYARMIAPPIGTLSGTRATSSMAAAWTMLQVLGIEKYTAIALHCMHLKERLVKEVLKIDGLRVVEGGRINLTVIYSEVLDLRPVSKELIKIGWMHTINQNPPPISICICTMPQNDSQIENFTKDLAEIIERKAVPLGEFRVEKKFDKYGDVNLDLDI
jgi:tyrosine decarboxylase/aspartate 1-decarboxylase